MSNQDKKRRLNTGGATAFNSLLNLVAKTTKEEPNKDNTTTKVEKKEAATVDSPVIANKETLKPEIPVKNNIQQEAKTEEAAIQSSKKETNTTDILGSNASNNENPAYTKKENELLKKFLSKRKSKGKTSPVLIDDLLKEKVDRISGLFGVTTTSFLCNVIEEHFKDNKNTYMDLINKKQPFSL